MTTLGDEMVKGKVLYRRKWRKCLFRDNGDGTAMVVFDRKGMVVTVQRGSRTYVFSGKMHTVPIDTVKEAKSK